MRKILLAATAFVIATAAAALPSGAGNVMAEYTIDPTSGPAGTEVAFESVTPCPVSVINGGVTNAPGDNVAAISRVSQPSASDFLADTLADGRGTWALTYAIPADEPAGEITFYAFCLRETVPTLDDATSASIPADYIVTQTYTTQVFTVTAPPPSSTTTTTSTSTTAVPVPPKLVANPTSVFPGDTIAVNAEGFAPGSNVVITLESDPVNLGTYVADSAGKIATNVVVPADFPAGNHTLKLTGTDIAGAVLVLSTGVTVGSRIQVPTTVAPATATAATLPQTGSSITEPAVAVAGGLVLLGSVALLAARRRRASAGR